MSFIISPIFGRGAASTPESCTIIRFHVDKKKEALVSIPKDLIKVQIHVYHF